MKLAILGSTRGSHLPSLVEAIEHQQLQATIKIVISNKEDAGILTKAQHLGLAYHYLAPLSLTREAYDQQLAILLRQYQVDLIILLGYMRILSTGIVNEWSHKILNIHPSLLPAYAGLMDLNVHRAVIQAGDTISGCTVHLVTEVVDAGPPIKQKTCPVFADDTPESLKARVQRLEVEALIEAINSLQKI